MEIIEVTGTVSIDCGVLQVSHVRAGLSRGLEPGEELVLVDEAGEFHAGVVSGIEFELEDTVYVVAVGARLSADLVEQRRRGVVAGSEEAALHDVVDLLGKLRGRWVDPAVAARIPHARPARHQRTGQRVGA